MSENPYQSPQISEALKQESSSRRAAIRSFRIATIVLFIPAVINYWAFDAVSIGSGPLPDDLKFLFRVVNVTCLAITFALIWFLGLPLVEKISRLLRNLFARRSDEVAWQTVLYGSLSWIPFLALPGAALWLIWVFGFYQLGWNFYLLSWAIGVPAHVLAACWYVPLIYRWYQLAQRPLPE